MDIGDLKRKRGGGNLEIGLGLDASLNLSFGEQEGLSLEAARTGYTSLWTPEGIGQDAFQLCALRWAATRQESPEGLTTGIAVSPVMYRSPVAFAISVYLMIFANRLGRLISSLKTPRSVSASSHAKRLKNRLSLIAENVVSHFTAPGS